MNNAVPTISVITATFNAAKVLHALIESMRAQSDRNFEWVVVDGASNDGTVDILDNAGDVVTRWISEPDFGIYDALNKAVRLASGEYYLVVGADDLLNEQAIENYRKEAARLGADVVTAPIVVDGKRIYWKNGPSWLYGQAAFVSSHSVGALFRKSLHDKYGMYSRKFPIAADQLFIKRVCMGGASLHRAGFVAGEFGSDGSSSVDVAGTLSEVYRVQLETEGKYLQTFLYILRLLKNLHRL